MYCSNCGAKHDGQVIFCQVCGHKLSPQAGNHITPHQPDVIDYYEYAGLGKRLLAAMVDQLILGLLGLIFGLLLGLVLIEFGTNPKTVKLLGNIFAILLSWTYFAALESSPKQATFGKMALGIVVTDLWGNRISFAKATGRHFGKILSALTLGIGFLMIAFTKKKQGLHDIIAGCLVLNE